MFLKIHYRFKKGMTLFSFFFIAIFILLGIWQQHRYEEKKLLLSLYHMRLNTEPVPFLTIKENENHAFQRVKVKGYYDHSSTLLIQNKIHQGELGFEVLTAFQVTGDHKQLLVDRGWVKQFSENNLPTDMQTITGYIKYNEYQFILGDNILRSNKLPFIIQKIDWKELGRLTHHDYYPFILRLNPTMPYGYIREWDMGNILPERHLGYMIQWFLMAIVLFVAYLCFSLEWKS